MAISEEGSLSFFQIPPFTQHTQSEIYGFRFPWQVQLVAGGVFLIFFFFGLIRFLFPRIQL